MSPKILLNAVKCTAAGIAIVAATAGVPVSSAQAGEIITKDCLHGSAANHSFGYGNQFSEDYGRGHGDQFGTSYSYTRPDTFRFQRGFGFRRGFIAHSTNPNGGGSITGADSGATGGYRSGSSNGYGTGSRSESGDDSCVETRRELVNPYIIQVPQPQNEKDVADLAARERLWQARCKPVIRQDVQGVRRYQYAAAGCDYGKYE